MKLEDARSILIFGGTFDPPTRAHAELPEWVRKKLGADCVAYVPAGISPLKRGRAQTPAAHRLAMLRLAVGDSERSIILTDELDRAGAGEPTYTVDTLRGLRARLGPGVTMRLLIGADQYRLFDRWREPEEVVQLAEPVVMVRPPDTRETLLASPPGIGSREQWAARLLEAPRMDISATAVRERVAAGMPIDDLVPAAVAAYIAGHGLYRR